MPLKKRWELAESFPKEFIQNFPDLHPIILQLLYNRNIKSKNAVTRFLDPDYQKGLHDPFLVKDMQKACNRIFWALEKKEKIVIYGDYDADGITASTLLYKTLKFLGAKKIETYIPHRQKEGYGLNKQAVKDFSKQKVQLIITVDCGISNIKQIALASELGIDVIISDHHTLPPKLPKAYAILNVKREKDQYPFKDLAGVGIAFKLAQALLRKDRTHSALEKEVFEKWLLDLVAIGTVADLSPLVGENRVLVKYGLIILNQSRRIGLKKIFQKTSLNPKVSPLNTYNIGYQIAPRLNAVGRMLHANKAYQLLLTNSEREAEKLAQDLEKTNYERQKITQDILNQAQEQLGKIEDKKILLASHPSWSSGIAGLVAGKICDRYSRPTLIIEKGEKESTGSARSINAFNITSALEKCSEFLIRFGGHKTAAGFTLKTEKITFFYQKLQDIAQKKIKDKHLKPCIEIEALLKTDQINWALFEQIQKFEPFGEGNPAPRFLAKNVLLKHIRAVGQGNKHLKLKLQSREGKIFNAIGFGQGDWLYKLIPGDRIDIVYELDSDNWNGNKEIQLKIIDLRLTNTTNTTIEKGSR